jgi:hypothetical protein
MGIRIVWDDEQKTIIRHVYEGRWTLEDYYALIDANYHEIDSVNHRVDIINDLRKMTGMPSNLTAAIRYAARHAHKNEGINVMVGSTTFIKILVETINKVVGEHTEVIYTDTIEQAYKIIAKHRGESPPEIKGQDG